MADLTNLEAAQTIKIVGSDATGIETNAVNATVSNELKVSDATVGTNTLSISNTSNTTAINSASIVSNQTNGSQKIQLTDAAGSLFQVTKIDSANSTNSLLGISGVFTGSAWTDVSNYSTLSLVVFSDQPSALNGLTIQYSTDGTNIDDNDQYTISASNGQQFSFALACRYYRIVYTNGTAAQGVFRLQSKTHSTPIKPSSYRIGTGVGNGEQDAELVMNVNARLPLTASSPASVSAGVASGTLIAANVNRKGLVITNTSSLGIISLNLANGSAVLSSGITLYPHDTWYMDEWSFTTAQIDVIASLAATSVAIQELT